MTDQQSEDLPAALARAAAELVAMGRFLAGHDLLPATSGNLSCRLDAQWVAVTRSGVDKGELVEADILAVPLHQPPPPGVSAETPLHLALYRARPQVGAVLHTHSLASTIVSQWHEAEGHVTFQGYEMQKALAGQTTHEHPFLLPVFPNSQDIPTLAERISARLEPDPTAVAYLLAGHGLYAWGHSLAEARRHVVALEFLLNCTMEKRRMRQ